MAAITTVLEMVESIIITEIEKMDIITTQLRDKLSGYAPSKPVDNSHNFIAFNSGEQRMKIKTGKFLAKKLGLKDKISDESIQKAAANINIALFGCEVKISKEKAITEHYQNATGGNSCMTGSCCEYTLMYEQNPNRYSILTIESGNDSARAMLVKLDNGKYLLDRVYATSESLKRELYDYGRKNGYYSDWSSNGMDNFSNSELVVSGLEYTNGHVPYQDTLTKYKFMDDGHLMIFSDNCGDFDYDGMLESTEGYLEKLQICCCCGEAVNEDDQYYGQDGGGPYCCDCYYNEYFTCEYCGEDCQQNEATVIGEEPFCVDCRDELFDRCHVCDEYHSIDAGAQTVGDELVCIDCLNRNYTLCDSCEKYAECDDVNDNGNCPDCVDLIRIHKSNVKEKENSL